MLVKYKVVQPECRSLVPWLNLLICWNKGTSSMLCPEVNSYCMERFKCNIQSGSVPAVYKIPAAIGNCEVAEFGKRITIFELGSHHMRWRSSHFHFKKGNHIAWKPLF